MMGALLEIDELTIRVAGRTLVRDLTMRVNPGEVWCILGANGVGKTLLLHTVVGLRGPTGAAIRFAGRPAGEWTTLEAAKIRAFLPQTLHDAFSAKVLDVVMMGRHPHLSPWAWEGEIERRLALKVLDAVNLRDMSERDVLTLSGGERQRAAIAALMVQDSPLLLLDEPVAHLDLRHQIAILQRLADLAKLGRSAVVFSIHDLNLAARFATHAMLFRADGFVDHGLIRDVMGESALSTAFRHPVARIAVGERTVFVAN